MEISTLQKRWKVDIIGNSSYCLDCYYNSDCTHFIRENEGKTVMVKSERVSESIRLGTILALAGGYMDAYSYMVRGGVFANAETGNIVLMGINLAQGNWIKSLYYLVPVMAFAAGIFVAERIREKVGDHPRVHWKEGVLWAEILLIFIAGWIPQAGNSLVNSMIAFICAMQVEAYRKIRGKVFATTMCTGNLRSGTELLCAGEFRKDPEKRKEAFHFFWINLVFIGGAALGTILCKIFQEKAIWFCGAILLMALSFIMYQKRSVEV